jgi:hypothetical protein
MSLSDQRVEGLINRRDAICGAAGLVTTAAGALAAGAAVAKAAPRIELAFDDQVWNREMVARLEADIAPGRFVNGYVTGIVHGVRDGEAVRPLLGFEVFSAIRVLRQPDGSYQRLCRELIFYRDLKTGALLDEWDNPYSGERVRVVDVANDPFNYVISEYFPEPPSYGGLNAAQRPPRRPLRLNWAMVGDDMLVLERDIHLYYKNALDPAMWPRESSGAMNRVSEMFRYVIRREDAENPALTHLPHVGFWSRVTPWLPWMLMGQGPGHVLYMGRFNTVTPDQVPAAVLARVKERFPQYLVAPEKWTEPSLSSLENYARTQKPAPPR